MRSSTLVALAGVTLLTLTSCTAHDPAAIAGPGTDPIENCGEQVQLDAPPERVVSLNQGSTEILYALGLGDRMVGTATWTDPVLPEFSEVNRSVPRLADNAPSMEAVLDVEPDFVTASFGSTLGEGGVAAREQFHELGVGTYLSPTDCVGKVADSGDGVRETPLTPDLLYREITELATIFDVEQAGDELVADLQRRLDEAVESVDARGISAMYWFANSESPYLAGCCGAPGLISTTLGLENVFDDTTQEWPQISWEVVAERDPDVIVVGDLTRKSQTAETAGAKIAYLESNPVTREMAAVREKRFIDITGAEMNPSLRTIYGVETVAAGLTELGLAEPGPVGAPDPAN
ncbi:ABC transporter substrate-binding protein [Dietzia maris]|jgi:iron complex transport system substrate-binding protein|uniref:ABC transporter substrate-binding protein n=1 Tax=Dietzia TaxID=37914 RepID=UPI000E88C9E8|nr:MULTISPECIES: ABC transporter substrate-binding protein [Dietzia]MBB0990949.1 ABC transporter substrate-binding protein [Dietzia sp. SLG510A3-30A2]MBB0993347.1 ABC transporter substrate-binding protein [Dietzia sp. SLG510A3-40A3]MBB1009930.1 ABC transporter substrate-binding protein [Dietzia sp. SLG510A3-3B2-2]HBD22120.1 ABC transporter substrate-binding protein [Dietzia sp.]MBB0997587.1 ABC transporter substrate-binding protein [Dietzia maris]